MDCNIKLLNYIHKNSQMGLLAIEQILGIVEDDNFEQALKAQNEEYKKIYDECEEIIEKKGKKVKEATPMTKIFSYITININTLTNKSSSHISELMIRGATMGIIDITEKMKEYSEADKDILDLADKLLKFEQGNIEQLKKFL